MARAEFTARKQIAAAVRQLAVMSQLSHIGHAERRGDDPPAKDASR
jgi:hypothetical protein